MHQEDTSQSLAHISLSPPLSAFVLICFACFPHTSFHKHELQDKHKRLVVFFFNYVVLENWVGRERSGFFFINTSINHLIYPGEEGR